MRLVDARTVDWQDRARTDRVAEMCALDDAQSTLAQKDPRRAEVIELRFFGGLGVEQTADALRVSPQTLMRDRRLARAWLAAELRQVAKK